MQFSHILKPFTITTVSQLTHTWQIYFGDTLYGFSITVLSNPSNISNMVFSCHPLRLRSLAGKVMRPTWSIDFAPMDIIKIAPFY